MQDLGSVPRVIERKLGTLPHEAMLKIKQALLFTLNLELDFQQPDESEANILFNAL